MSAPSAENEAPVTPGRSFLGLHGDCTTDHPHTHAASQPGPTPDDAEKDRGLEGRYRVEKINDPTGKHDGCRYFVLDPAHDTFAVAALRTYAAQVGGPLAEDIDAWLRSLGYCPRCSQVAGHRGACPIPPDETRGLDPESRHR